MHARISSAIANTERVAHDAQPRSQESEDAPNFTDDAYCVTQECIYGFLSTKGRPIRDRKNLVFFIYPGKGEGYYDAGLQSPHASLQTGRT